MFLTHFLSIFESDQGRLIQGHEDAAPHFLHFVCGRGQQAVFAHEPHVRRAEQSSQ
jgi:hypothetical protein